MLLAAIVGRAAPQVLFVAGPPSHGPGEHRFPESSALLADALAGSGLPLEVHVSKGWPEDAVLDRAQTVVIYSDGLDAHVAAGHVDALRRHVAAGKGLVVLHFALEPNPGALADLILESVGGRFEPSLSVNPMWKPKKASVGQHEVTRGVGPIEVEDEWYYHLRFLPGVTPVLQALPPTTTLGAHDGPRAGNPSVRAALSRGELQTLGWVYERDGRRAFGFTGGHYHRNWTEDAFRKLVLNGIAWTAGVAVPDGGVPSSVAPAVKYATIDEAIARGDIDDVRRHLSIDKTRAQRRPDAPMSPLHQAILRNRTEIAVVLLEAGADPDAADKSRRTPLHLCVERGNAAVAKALVERKAKPNELDQIGWTPMHHAAAKDRVEIVRTLLAGGANPMTLSERGGTPLHEAAASGSAEMVQLLLDHKVDPKVVSKTGVTALDIAREFKNEAAIRILEPLTSAR